MIATKQMASSLLAAVLAMDNTDAALLSYIIEPNYCKTRKAFTTGSEQVVESIRRAANYDGLDLKQARYRCVIVMLCGLAVVDEFDFPAHYLLQRNVRAQWIEAIYDHLLTLRKAKRGQYRVEVSIERRRHK